MIEQNNSKKSEIKDQIKKIISYRLEIPIEKCVPSAEFFKDLRADSLDCVDIVITLEDKFNIEKMKNIQDIYDYFEEKT